jgi:hypothetical protein
VVEDDSGKGKSKDKTYIEIGNVAVYLSVGQVHMSPVILIFFFGYISKFMAMSALGFEEFKYRMILNKRKVKSN